MVNTNRKPAKYGSKEHHRRISESLKNGKPKKKGLIRSLIAKRFHPDNVRQRKIQNDPEYKKARKARVKAEGDVAAGFKLSKERRQQIHEHFKKLKEKEDQAQARAVKKHSKDKSHDD